MMHLVKLWRIARSPNLVSGAVAAPWSSCRSHGRYIDYYDRTPGGLTTGPAASARHGQQWRY